MLLTLLVLAPVFAPVFVLVLVLTPVFVFAPVLAPVFMFVLAPVFRSSFKVVL